MSKSKSVATSNCTRDIVRKGTDAYRLARMLSDGRRKNGATRQEIIAKLGIENPAAYVAMYDCFVRVERGRYAYVGNAL